MQETNKRFFVSSLCFSHQSKQIINAHFCHYSSALHISHFFYSPPLLLILQVIHKPETMLSKIGHRVGAAAVAAISARSGSATAAATIVATRSFSLDYIGKRYDKPYDYKNKRYGLWGQITDSTMRKLGENSLIITVDGNFGAGKSAFAKQLAKEIDFVYAREPDLETHLFELPNGHNRRLVVNELVADNERYRIDSLDEWHLSPSYKKAIKLQHNYYLIRWMQTRTALLHLMSTGKTDRLQRRQSPIATAQTTSQ